MSDKKQKLLLVGWDSADWKIIDSLLADGGLEGVRSLMEGGIHGNLATLEPQLSPMLWTSIATGKMADAHGVHGFTEVDPISGQVVPVSAASRKCKTVWEMLAQEGKKSHLVSWFASQGEKMANGKMVSNMFGHLRGTKAGQDPADWPAPMAGTYWPEELAEVMNELRVSPHEIDGEVLHPFIPDGAKIDQTKDRRVINLMIQLAEAYSVHSSAMHLMESDPDWDFMAVYYRAIDEISHFFMPYHPPRMEGIAEEDFELYQHVVNSTYRAHDMMLASLLQMAGPDTTVLLVSDHGFHSDHLRPAFTPQVPAGITVWHRSQGVLLAKGPGIKTTSEPVYGARLLDITPTILHHFGLPVGADMEGRVLTELFEEMRPVETIPTWEHDDGAKERHASLSASESEALLEQFVALGYIDEVPADPTEAARGTIRENKWNLARAYLYGGKYEEALPLLEDCVDECPERADYAQLLARSQLSLGLTQEAEETLAIVLESFGNPFAAHLLQAQIAQQKGDSKAALEHLEVIEKEAPRHPQVLELLCRCAFSLQLWQKARDAATTLLECDGDNHQARITMARVSRQERKFQDAVEHALTAVKLQFGDPRGHALLGHALSSLGHANEAKQAFINCLKLNPEHPTATTALVRILRDQGQLDQAAAVEAKALNLRFEREKKAEARLESLRSGIGFRARERHQARMEREANQRSSEVVPEGDSMPEAKTFTIVSGLPRSGTSLMMQMLTAAGLPAMSDRKRSADADNPEGYFEWEEIKQLPRNPRLIEQAEGKVVKVVSALLPHLPPRHRYRIVFMKRPVAEVVTSQWKMVERKGHKPRSERNHLIESQETHLAQMLANLQEHPSVELLVVDYPQLVADPSAQCQALTEFLGSQITAPENLREPIKPELHRNRP